MDFVRIDVTEDDLSQILDYIKNGVPLYDPLTNKVLIAEDKDENMVT